MGLFDKRKRDGDDFDSPVENIDLSAPALDVAPPAAHAGQPSERSPDPEPDDIEMDARSYGIDNAISLMRSLPADNIELVVQVVKQTLESTNVRVGTIIDDATRKQTDIEGRINVLKKEMQEYEQEISTRKTEIGKLEVDHRETTQVKDHLQLAEKLSTKPAARNTGATSPPLPGVSKPAAAAPARSHGGNIPPTSGSITSSGAASTASGTAGARTQTTAKGTTIVAKK